MQATDKEFERFMQKVVVINGCWIYTGPPRRGRDNTIEDPARRYGGFSFRGKTFFAHRWIYNVWNGVVLPWTMTVDHTCDTPGCVKPAHLRPMTMHANAARGGRNHRPQLEAA